MACLPPSFIVPVDSELFRTLRRAADSKRIVFFAGLPGVGKSLLIQQLASLAHAAGRRIFTLQWDVARAAFETDAILSRYPETDGITHSAIRKAVGLWARVAVLGWHRQHANPDGLLIGETPLIGNRLIELAKSQDDDAEPLLRDEQTHFIIPVPSREIRQVVEQARLRSSVSPQHEREQADAMPNVMRALWNDLYEAAATMGVVSDSQHAEFMGYNPEVYQAVYEQLLKHRHCEAAHLDMVLETGSRSVYDFDAPHSELIPDAREVSELIELVERVYPDMHSLERETSAWYSV